VPAENLILLCYKNIVLFPVPPLLLYALLGWGMLQSNECCLALYVPPLCLFKVLYFVSACCVLNSTNIQSGMLLRFFRFIISMTFL